MVMRSIVLGAPISLVAACLQSRLVLHPPVSRSLQNVFCLEPPFACLGFARFMQAAVLSSVGKVLARTDSFDIETHEACDWVRLFKSKKASPRQRYLENKLDY